MTIRKEFRERAKLNKGDDVELSIIDGEQITAKPGDIVLRRL